MLVLTVFWINTVNSEGSKLYSTQNPVANKHKMIKPKTLCFATLCFLFERKIQHVNNCNDRDAVN